jgi:hypothetical protein
MPKSTKTQQPKDEKRDTISLFHRKYFLKYAFGPKTLYCFNDIHQTEPQRIQRAKPSTSTYGSLLNKRLVLAMSKKKKQKTKTKH